MAKREIPEINAGSMADIAFLLLIFFLVTTTMDVDTGIIRQLPPWEPEQEDDSQEINERNIYVVLINRNDDLLVEGRPMNITQLREGAKTFVTNPRRSQKYSDQETLQQKLDEELEKSEPNEALVRGLRNAINYFGPSQTVSKGVVSLQNDRGTTYKQYISVQNELVAAYNELRDELSMQTFGQPYEELLEAQRDAVKLVYPQAISEAEPRNIGGK